MGKDEWLANLKRELEEGKNIKPHDLVSPSIFMAPSLLRGFKPKDFIPQVVAIGPYHNKIDPFHTSDFTPTRETERSRLLAVKETEKYKILAANETARKFRNKHFDSLITELRTVLDQVKVEYGNDFESDSNETLAYMLGLDACFVVEVLRCCGEPTRNLWPGLNLGSFDSSGCSCPLRKSIVQDFLLLENQIPLFLLQRVIRMDESVVSDDDAEQKLGSWISKTVAEVLPFTISSPGTFSCVMHKMGSRKHLLDCLYCIATHESTIQRETKIVEKPTHFPTAVNLHNAGIRFEATSGNVMEVKFDSRRAILRLPKIRVGEETERLLRNLVAYESHLVDKVEVLSYINFMGCLVGTDEDAALLVEKGVIEQGIGGGWDGGVKEMWRNVRMKAMGVWTGEHEKAAKALNKHCKGKVSVLMAAVRRTTNSNNPAAWWLVVVALLAMSFFTRSCCPIQNRHYKASPLTLRVYVLPITKV